MLTIQLRGKWAGLVPINCVPNIDRSMATVALRATDAPGLLVDFFDGRRYGVSRICRLPPVAWGSPNLHLLNMRTKVANLIQRVPGRNLNEDMVLHIRNGHDAREIGAAPDAPGKLHSESCHAERAKCKTETEKVREVQKCVQHGKKTNHLLVAPDGTRASSPSFLVSFSHNPSKLPLDITSKRSPGSASAANTPAISSLLPKTRASFPSERILCATDLGVEAIVIAELM